jgi:hypothetical protein
MELIRAESRKRDGGGGGEISWWSEKLVKKLISANRPYEVREEGKLQEGRG